MNARTLIGGVAVGAALTLIAPSAQAATLERFDRTAFDTTPDASAAGWSISHATAGELGGWLDMTVRAQDGSIPENGQCEMADVDAVLTVSPGESFAVHTTGELCAHFIDGTPSLFGSFGDRQATYTGTHRKARIVGDGNVGFGSSWLGAQGAVTLAVRW